MSKVIRIPQEIFERLQIYAEPLIDTPADIIKKILDFYEENRGSETTCDEIKNKHSYTDLQEEANASPGTKHQQSNLYLAPASLENINTSIISNIGLDFAKNHLPNDALLKLQNALGGKNHFNCWAMTESKVSFSKFREMKSGDTVLFSIKGTGKFNLKGQVVYKFISEKFGNALWPVTSGLPWKLIYVLKDIEKININKQDMVTTLGFKPNYIVPGVVRVNNYSISNILKQYRSIEDFIKSFI